MSSKCRFAEKVDNLLSESDYDRKATMSDFGYDDCEFEIESPI